MNKLLKSLNAFFAEAKFISEIENAEWRIRKAFIIEKDRLDRKKTKLFKVGDRVKFINPNGFDHYGIIERKLLKKIQIKTDDDYTYRVMPTKIFPPEGVKKWKKYGA